MISLRHALCGLGALLVLAATASAQQAAPAAGRPTVAAARLADGESITLDGRLDEAVWPRAVPTGDFVQIDPANGQPPTERTEVRIAFDADAFYMGVTNYDSDPTPTCGSAPSSAGASA